MRDLYKALTLIAVDVPLRDAVIAAHGMDDRPELLRSASCMPKPPHNLRWERQPNLPRLDQIDQLFRAKSVFMTAYELSEINRWVHEPGFAGALENFRTALPNGVRTAAEQQQPALWEAIGVLVVDPDLCDRLTANVENLTNDGFAISITEEDRLRVIFASGSAVRNAGDAIRNMGWSGTCASRYRRYSAMIHLNM